MSHMDSGVLLSLRRHHIAIMMPLQREAHHWAPYHGWPCLPLHSSGHATACIKCRVVLSRHACFSTLEIKIANSNLLCSFSESRAKLFPRRSMKQVRPRTCNKYLASALPNLVLLNLFLLLLALSILSMEQHEGIQQDRVEGNPSSSNAALPSASDVGDPSHLLAEYESTDDAEADPSAQDGTSTEATASRAASNAEHAGGISSADPTRGSRDAVMDPIDTAADVVRPPHGDASGHGMASVGPDVSASSTGKLTAGPEHHRSPPALTSSTKSS